MYTSAGRVKAQLLVYAHVFALLAASLTLIKEAALRAASTKGGGPPKVDSLMKLGRPQARQKHVHIQAIVL